MLINVTFTSLIVIFSNNSEIEALKQKMADLEARLVTQETKVSSKLDRLLALAETPNTANTAQVATPVVVSPPPATASQQKDVPPPPQNPLSSSTPTKEGASKASSQGEAGTNVLDALEADTSDTNADTNADTSKGLMIVDSTEEGTVEKSSVTKSPEIILQKQSRDNRMAKKRKLGKSSSSDEQRQGPSKKLKLTPRDRLHQEARNEFTTALTRIPAWLPDDWSPAALITNRFFWVHEEARCRLLACGKNKGEKYPGYRLEFHKEAVICARAYDEEREALFREQADHKHFSLAYIMPWYFKHDKKWKRPQIHPDTSRIAIKRFVFRTNIDFINNFLNDLVGRFPII